MAQPIHPSSPWFSQMMISFKGSSTTPFLHAPKEFQQLAPIYTNSQGQARHPEEDKAHAIGTQHLENKKRKALRPIAPKYTNSQEQAGYPGEDKSKALGTQHLGSKKRSAPQSPDKPAAIEKENFHLSCPINWSDSAQALFCERDYKSALEIYEKILSDNDPTHHKIALYKKSICCWKLGDLKKAKETLDDLLHFFPQYPEGWAKRGAVLIQMHQYPEALSDLKKGVALCSTSTFLEFVLLLDCYHSFEQVKDTASFYLQHPSFDFDGKPLLSQEDVYLLRGIFFASQKDFSSACTALSLAWQTSSNSLAIKILATLQRYSKPRIRLRRQERSVTLQTGRVPISVLLNGNS